MKIAVRVFILLLILGFIFGCDPITPDIDPDPDEDPPAEELPEDPPNPEDPQYTFVVAFPDGTIVGFAWDGTNFIPQRLTEIPVVSDILRCGVSIEDITYSLDIADHIHLSLLIRNIGPHEITNLDFFCKINFPDGSNTYHNFNYYQNISLNQLNLEDTDSNIAGPAESIEFLQLDPTFYMNGGYWRPTSVLDFIGYYTFYPP